MEILEHANKLLDKKRELYEISNQLDRKVLEYNEHLRALETEEAALAVKISEHDEEVSSFSERMRQNDARCLALDDTCHLIESENGKLRAKLNELADTMAGVDELISIRSTEFNQGLACKRFLNKVKNWSVEDWLTRSYLNFTLLQYKHLPTLFK